VPVINTDWIPTLMDLCGLGSPSGLDGLSFAPVLTGRGSIPARDLFWHFPHYTNQGSRPTGAMRHQNWVMIEYYDADAPELYDLSSDVGESRDVAAQNPDRVPHMRAALSAWRDSIRAQTNAPNPGFDAAKFKDLYLDVDASRFDPPKANKLEWQKMADWRKEMNAVLQKDKNKQSAQ
jgi:arylsulfatase A-like enzyme